MWIRLLSYRRLAWALLLSLLLHLLLLGETPDWLQDNPLRTPPIEVELLPPPQPAKIAAVPLPEPRPVPLPKAVHKPAEPPPEPAAEPLPDPAPVIPPPEPAAVTPEPVEPPPVAEAAPEPPAVQAEAEPEPEAIAEQAAPAPRQVAIDFRVSYKGSDAGEERHRYQARDDGSYTLSSVAVADGLMGLFLSELHQQSEGRVTEQGLRPSVFVYQYGKDADRLQKAVFDWKQHRLWLQSGRRVQVVDMRDDAQDLLSFMYQFMFSPPLQQMSLAITNGKRLKVYDYSFVGEEMLATRMGELRSIHIQRESADEEKTELWLAADYHYLPVRIRMSEKDGKVTDRIAVRLQLN